MEARADQLDEALLSNCFAWMKKCQEDRFDSMVLLLQKVLQLYAARALRTPDKEVGLAGWACGWGGGGGMEGTGN
jgi:sensor domain CHASE-containing protein